MKVDRGVPVLMFHSVRPAELVKSPLSVPVEVFLPNMESLVDHGYETITLQQLYDYKTHNIALPKKPIIVTFDDGYLDNWVYAYPILKKLGMTATIFPTIEFIGDGEARPVWNCEINSDNGVTNPPEYLGSLRWAELQGMQSSSVFEVQSHTMTHARLFSGPSIDDFVKPGDKCIWLQWNLNESMKPYQLEGERQCELPLGYPIFQSGRALGVRQFFPYEDLVHDLTAYVRCNGREEFFLQPNWRSRLNKVLSNSLSNNGKLGYLETEQEYRRRVNWELITSKKILEDRLSKPVKYLSWPGGSRTKIAEAIAAECGYLATTVPSSERRRYRNRRDEASNRIVRMGSCSKWSYRGKGYWMKPGYFLAEIDSYRGSIYGSIRSRVDKVKLSTSILVSMIVGRDER